MSLDSWLKVPPKKIKELETQLDDLPNVDEVKIQAAEVTRNHLFQVSWLKLYPWLVYNQDIGMTCELCISNNIKSVFTRGCKNYRTSTLERHRSSKEHKNSAQSVSLRKNLTKAVHKQIKENDKALLMQLRTAFYIAQEELPNSQFPKLLQFLSEQECPGMLNLKKEGYGSYTCHQIVEDMHCAIGMTVENHVDEKIQTSKFIGLMIDESTDVGNFKKIIVYATCIPLNTNSVEIVFLKNLEIINGTAETLVAVLLDLLEKKKIPIEKIIGICTDGAAVMLGDKNGVAARLKRLNSKILPIHCMAHRLALCVSKAAKDVPLVKKYQDTLANIFHYFTNSPIRAHTLKDVQELLNEPQLRYVPLHSVRWLSISNSVKVVYRTLNSLITTLDSEAEEKQNSQALGLVKEIKKYSFVSLTYILNDILSIIQCLTKLFQAEDLCLSKIEPLLTITKQQLTDLKTVAGPCELELARIVIENNLSVDFKGHKLTLNCNTKEQPSRAKNLLIDNILQNIENRFPTISMAVISKFNALIPQKIEESQLNGTLSTFENESIKSLAIYYELDVNEVLREFNAFKHFVINSGYVNLTINQLCKILLTQFSDNFPNIITILQIAVILPVSTVPVKEDLVCKTASSINLETIYHHHI